jgi:hypothetical protein
VPTIRMCPRPIFALGGVGLSAAVARTIVDEGLPCNLVCQLTITATCWCPHYASPGGVHPHGRPASSRIALELTTSSSLSGRGRADEGDGDSSRSGRSAFCTVKSVSLRLVARIRSRCS